MSKQIKLPGLIDIHVHLRDFEFSYKEDFYTGTCAALGGGITTVFDMPNSIPPTLTMRNITEKIKIAKEKAVCDWGLYFGTNGRNMAEFSKAASLTVGLKLYLNETTGGLTVDDPRLAEKIFLTWPKQKIIIVHAEGDNIDLAINLSGKHNRKIHLTHINTKKDLDKIIDAKRLKYPITCDTTPHYLFLTSSDLNYIGEKAVVTPKLATQTDQDFLWDNLESIDCLVTDHAPHTIAEKKQFDPLSGFPGLETLLPLMLTAVNQKRISLNDLIRLTNINPQKIYNFKQDEGNYILVDMEEKYQIDENRLLTKNKWSPFHGFSVQGKIKEVFLHDKKVMIENKFTGKMGIGQQVIV